MIWKTDLKQDIMNYIEILIKMIKHLNIYELPISVDYKFKTASNKDDEESEQGSQPSSKFGEDFA